MKVPFEQRHELFSFTATSPASPSPPSGSNPSGNARAGSLVLPVVHQDKDYSLLLVERDDLRTYLEADLDVEGLNKIHKHLWFAGLPQCARPRHLLWRDYRLYLKPLPDYLLSYGVWERTLLKDQDLRENAKGFLLSYLWLIRQKSDFIIAQRENLVSNALSWEHWTTFSVGIFANVVSDSFEDISPRYLYGELRLGRVNLIYRLCRKTRNFKTFMRGHFYGYRTYSSFIEQNFAWVLTVIVYITIVLTAMQVGLATTELQSSQMFDRASYAFTVFSIMAPLGVLLVLLLVLLFLVILHFDHAIKKRSTTRESFRTVFDNVALRPYNH